MFTGQFSTENGMWRGPGKGPLGSPGYRGIKRDVIMLSEHLSRTGYHTGCFGKWHMGSLEGEVPNDRGFDEFHGFLAGAHSALGKENGYEFTREELNEGWKQLQDSDEGLTEFEMDVVSGGYGGDEDCT